jgi:ribA/ribD-fused uncharacterized protein
MATKKVGNIDYEIKEYLKKKSLSFAKVNAPFGGLHNMAPGYPITIGDIVIKTSEHLYQACRFPHDAHIQEEILNTPSPMSAKMVMKKYIEQSREDWDEVKFLVMRWCLLLKLTQNWSSFGALLEATRNAALVEYSKNDDFWGAVPSGDLLVGVNALGRLLMQLRDHLPQMVDKSVNIKPPQISNLLLIGSEIQEFKSEILTKIKHQTTVINKYHNAPYDVDISRGSIWGNPFSHMENTKAKYKVATREESLESYDKWLDEPEQAHLRAKIPELYGKILACTCAPQDCHGDILARRANKKAE